MRGLHNNVWLLTVISALALSAGAMIVLVGGIVGATLAPSPALATLPVAFMVIGTALGVYPVTRMMQNLGRKPVFIGVAVLAALASFGSAWMISLDAFWLYLATSGILGVAIAGFQQIRFAAMESVEPESRPKAASTVLLGGLAAAIIGPELASTGKDLITTPFSGSYIALGLVAMLCAGLFTLFRENVASQHNTETEHVSLGPTAYAPRFVIAVSSAVVGYALMSFVMTATPVHMHVFETHSMQHTKWVIQSHILAMFLPSLVSGWLISRFGVYRMMAIGLGLYLLTIAMAFSGSALLNYWLALVLLGIGWNFLFVSGTVLLPQTHSQAQSFRAQGVNDMFVFGAQATTALAAGAVLHLIGWQGLLLFSLSVVLLQSALLLWQWQRMRSGSEKD